MGLFFNRKADRNSKGCNGCSCCPELRNMDRLTLEMEYCNNKRADKSRNRAFDESHRAIFEKLNLGPNDVVVLHGPSPYPFMVESNNLLKTLCTHFGYKWLSILVLPEGMTIETIDAAYALELAQKVLGMRVIAESPVLRKEVDKG